MKKELITNTQEPPVIANAVKQGGQGGLSIHIGPGTDIDIGDMMQSRVIIQGNSGAGKSGLARKMMEESFGKVPFVVWDIEGEYYTLKELSGDIVVIGGLHGDVPVTPSLAEKLPAFIIDNQLTVVVDLSDMKMSERVRFTKEFFETLMDLPLPYWTAYQFYLEECHKLAGEQDKQESSTAIKDLMQRGRKRGFAGIVLTQRIGMLSKSVSAECNNKFIGRTSQDNDMDRSGKELGFRKNADSLKLRDLKRGHFFAFGPSMQPDYVHEVIVDKPKTTMVKAGMQLDFKPPKPTAKLLGMLTKLSEAAPSPVIATQEAMERAGGEVKFTDANEVAAVRIENRDLNERIDQMHISYSELQTELQEAERLKLSYTKLAVERGVKLNQITATLKTISEMALANIPGDEKELSTPDLSENDKQPYVPLPPREKFHRSFENPKSLIKVTDPKDTPSSNGSLPTGERRVLTAITQYKNGLNRKALTVITGYTRRTRDAYIFGLRNKGYADLSGDKIIATAAGIKILGPDFKRLPTGRALRSYWLNELPQGERTILTYMLDAGTNYKPAAVTREYISEKTGYTRRTRDAYIYNMLSKEIVKVTGKGEVAVSEYLFD